MTGMALRIDIGSAARPPELEICPEASAVRYERPAQVRSELQWAASLTILTGNRYAVNECTGRLTEDSEMR